MNKKSRQRKIYCIFLGLAIFIAAISSASAVATGDDKIPCPFESIDDKIIATDVTMGEKFSGMQETLLKISLSDKTRDDWSLTIGEGIGLIPPRTITYSSTQFTEPTAKDMQLQTGLQKKIGASWYLVASQPAYRATTTEISQSGSYYAPAGTYRTVGCHKVWIGGILVYHEDSSLAGELSIS